MICQIATYGGEKNWLKLGIQEKKPNWLVIVTNRPKNNNKRLLEDCLNLKKEIEDEQEEFPSEYKISVSIFDLTEFLDSYTNLFNAIISLFKKIIDENFELVINSTGGLNIVQIVLFQASLIFKDNVNEFFQFNKESHNIDTFWLNEIISSNDKKLMKILYEKGKASISEIQESFQATYGFGNLSYVVKLTNNLKSKKDLIKEEKIGKSRVIMLDTIGKALISSQINTLNLIFK